MAWEYIKEQNITTEILKRYYKDVKETFCKNIELPETFEIDIRVLEEKKLGRFEFINQKPFIHISTELINDIKNCEINSLAYRQYIANLIHIIHHEICHYDIEKKLPFIVDFFQFAQKPLKTEIYLYGYVYMFNEFMSCYLSRASFKFPFLIEQQKLNIKLALNEYIGSNKDFFQLISFGKDFAYLLGYLSHNNIEYIDKFISEIENKTLQLFCADAQKSLLDIGKKYPTISKSDIIEYARCLKKYF